MKRHNLSLILGGLITLAMLLMILIGAFHTPYDTTAMDPSAICQPPSAAHLMGTDQFGRDIFSRVLEGAGMSLWISLWVVAIGATAGILLGSLCGYFGGVADALLTRLCDAITAFPSVLLALVAISITGSGTSQIIYVLGILFIPSFARVSRVTFARCRSTNYIQSARLMGASHGRILLFHILPNTVPTLLPTIAIGFNNAILSEASMSYLGIGVRPPNPSLGLMLSESQTYLRRAPWYAGFVGLTMVLLILGFSLFGEGLQQRSRRNGGA